MLRRIERQSGSLSNAEQRVATWVLEHPRQTAEASIAAVANAAGTSDPTVVRFCRHLGLSGFRELKLRLAESLSRPTSYLHSDVSVDDSTADVLTKVIDRSIQALIDMRGTAISASLDEAITAIAAARQLVFCGVGASAHIACDANHKFFRLGIPCTAATDVPTMLQLAAVAIDPDVYVIISKSGETREPLAVSETLRHRGIQCIALTVAGSPLAKLATIVVDCQPGEDTSIVTPMSSRLAKLAVLDAMQVLLALRMGDAAERRLRDSKQVLETLRRPEPR